MLSMFRRHRPQSARINGTKFEVRAGETLLQSALRHNINLPNQCRVGACGACKCRLVEGRITALTDFDYVLSEAELEAGYILACQSTPRTAVVLNHDGMTGDATTRGQILHQTRLTHDITALTVALSTPLSYRPGQYALLELDRLPGVKRAYSFAAPATPDGTVTFFVRQVPTGRFSGAVNQQTLTGQALTLTGPYGEFWLRPADAPLLMVAGGSGLAPILAMLEQAAVQGCNRPTTVLFGARCQQDLYCQSQLADIQRRWQGHFHYQAVLSEEPADSSWAGARGLVTDQMAQHALNGCHAYLCGPPAMVDAAKTHLEQRSVLPQHIHTDPFISQPADPDPA
ncbi:2Fe-2S iron-sulfur cluster-binding protein [Ferrimonas balearica]|uniref:2Fe-2S iron-sulfur cluster-binding protein n=1 Tax=Ferrimonas balearica TaxID=44012 RepID=UPI001C96CF76|nr:2Fe-2S iron-sulfur cluster binding domain-containing protein [Ferrimonas balearica]MBY6223636.1 2Fe-2S iron-sulfur cluster binding domain-containing protein [Ferrimonas balearica]